MSSDTPHFKLSRRGALLGLLGLAGCGFQPVYGTNGVATKLQNTLRFTGPETVFGFRVRTALEGRFGKPVDGAYLVKLSLTDSVSAAAVTVNGDTTRFDITGKADWSLQRPTGQIVTIGSVQSFTSYAATGSTVATQVAERDARDRLAQILSDMVATDLVFAADLI